MARCILTAGMYTPLNAVGFELAKHVRRVLDEGTNCICPKTEVKKRPYDASLDKRPTSQLNYGDYERNNCR